MSKAEEQLYKLTKKELIETLIYLRDKLESVNVFIDNKKIITPSGVRQIKEILKPFLTNCKILYSIIAKYLTCLYILECLIVIGQSFPEKK